MKSSKQLARYLAFLAMISSIMFSGYATADDDECDNRYSSSLSCQNRDSDGDGLSNGAEATLGTNPNLADSDGDGLNDGTEVGGNVSAPRDSDGDGVIDAREPNNRDADNDGTNDQADVANTDPCRPSTTNAACLTADTDRDGVPDARDGDNDNDGIPNITEGAGDSDGDGVPDARDPDSDNDGIPDIIEAGGVDADGNGRVDGVVDGDGDGVMDSVDPDNGGTPLPVPDTDGDGKPNYRDVDSDGDGIPDRVERGTGAAGPRDSDGDGKADYLDRDSDGDGLPDRLESQVTGLDGDGDGIDDAFDVNVTRGVDANADGIDDAIVPTNTDGDGLPDYRDIDADNDGIIDTVESNMRGSDADGDGLDDALDVGMTSGVDRNGDGIDDAYRLPDTDGDSVPDVHDLDTDNDSVHDVIEAGLRDDNGDAFMDVGQTVTSTPRDTDGDGVADFRDTDSNNDGILDIVSAGLGRLDGNGNGRIDAIADADRDGIPDVVDGAPTVFGNRVDGDGDGVSDSDDLDDDNDGIPDVVEGGGLVDTDRDGIPDSQDRDSDNDGIPDVVEGGGRDANGDGVIDDADNDSDNDGLADRVDPTTGGTPLPLPDSDGDGIPDYRDRDSDNDGVPDVIEGGGRDGNGDGLIDDADRDADRDGLPDSVDTSTGGHALPLPDANGNGVPDYLDPTTRPPGGQGTGGAGNPLNTTTQGAGSSSPAMLALLALFTLLRGRRRYLARLSVMGVVVLLLPYGSASADDLEWKKGWYVGGDLGLSRLEPEGDQSAFVVADDRSHGYRVLGGYDWSRFLSFEAFYLDAGSAKIDGANPAIGRLGDLTYSLTGLGVNYRPLKQEKRLVPYLKAGMAYTRNGVDDTRIIYDRDHPTGAFFGAGLAWRFASSWSLNTEWVSYDRDESFLSLGIRKSFGASQKPAPVVAAEPVFEAPVEVIPLPAVEVEPPVAMPPRDGDGDGVPDAQDRCPDTAPSVNVDARGCNILVIERDDDQDGIVNSRDKCPNSKPGARVDNLGCELPDIVILRGVHFETAASRLTADSKVVLNGVAETLRRYPDMLVEVAGHTDNRGSDSYNLNLSQQRAQAVAEYLFAQGVAKNNLIAKGYGETMPVRENITEAGRTTNRRVELHILRR